MREIGEIAWWRKTQRLAAAFGAGLAAVGFLLPVLGAPDHRPVFGLPFSTFLAVVVVPLIVLIALFAFAARQRGLDRRHDVAES